MCLPILRKENGFCWKGFQRVSALNSTSWDQEHNHSSSNDCGSKFKWPDLFPLLAVPEEGLLVGNIYVYIHTHLYIHTHIYTTHTICVHLLTLYTEVYPAAGLVPLLSHPRCWCVDTVQLLLRRLTHIFTATGTAGPPSNWPYTPNLTRSRKLDPLVSQLTHTKGLSGWSWPYQ